ncbi:hypothetical protein L1049_024218 [Liquidambar formosana]|uniref:riboflavin kinase n=1 Tax=Liquidambar formosana TaxID=63359 RepID=A0AAP0S164_LIQFO
MIAGVDNALPIEPIYVNGVFSNGFLCELTDDGPSSLPDQVFGLYFGWAKVDMHGIFKVVVGIGWDHSSCTAKRNIKLCLIDGSDDYVSDQAMELSLVGYIRKLSSKGCMDMEILEEDKSIASASLYLPMFSHHACTTLSPEASIFTDSAASDDEESSPGISASPSEDNMRYFNVMILGPTQSPYEGGVFKLELFLPEEYPMAAPKDFFVQLGRICLDILKDKWSPALQIRTVLLSIQALLSAPNPDDPLSENIAKHWKTNEVEAVETAKEWTRLYASGA